MKVKLLVSRGGPSGDFKRGDEIEVSDEEAIRMFAADPPQAEPVRDGGAPEVAVKPKPQKTSKPKPEKAVR